MSGITDNSAGIHDKYRAIAKTELTEGKDAINLQDIVRTTETKRGLKGKIVRIFHRLSLLPTKGWIDDEKAREILGDLANTPEKRATLARISLELKDLAGEFSHLNDEELSISKWDHEKNVSESLSELKQLEKSAKKLIKLSETFSEHLKGLSQVEVSIDTTKVKADLKETTTHLKRSATKLQNLYRHEKEVEEHLKLLRRIDPFTVLENSKSRLYKAFVDYLYTTNHIDVDEDQLPILYQEFISSIADEMRQYISDKADNKVEPRGINPKEIKNITQELKQKSSTLKSILRNDQEISLDNKNLLRGLKRDLQPNDEIIEDLGRIKPLPLLNTPDTQLYKEFLDFQAQQENYELTQHNIATAYESFIQQLKSDVDNHNISPSTLKDLLVDFKGKDLSAFDQKKVKKDGKEIYVQIKEINPRFLKPINQQIEKDHLGKWRKQNAIRQFQKIDVFQFLDSEINFSLRFRFFLAKTDLSVNRENLEKAYQEFLSDPKELRHITDSDYAYASKIATSDFANKVDETELLDSLSETIRTLREVNRNRSIIHTNVTLPKEILVESKAQYLLDHIDEIKEEMIIQIPNIKVDASRSLNVQTHVGSFNNYGLPLLNEPDMIGKTEEIQIEGYSNPVLQGKFSFTYQYLDDDGILQSENRTTEGIAFYDPTERKLFSTPASMIMCDIPEVSDQGGYIGMVADGCSQGLRSRAAAKLGADTVMQNVSSGKTLREIARQQIETLLEASQAIVEKGDEVGQTTLAEAQIIDGYLMGTYVGDSKIFIIGAEGECIEPTISSRDESQDARDSGGRIGNYVTASNGKEGADLRNFSSFAVKLKPGDRVIICSDGVHDNLDPYTLGKKPSDYGLNEESWDACLEDRHRLIRDKLRAVTMGCETPEQISNALDNYVALTTAKINAAQLAGVNVKDASHTQLLGKRDHAANVVMIYHGPA